MRIRGLVASATLGVALLLGGCGGGSGRSGTDLAVSGTGPTAQLNGGDAAVFVMTVANVGGFDASNVTIRNSTTQLSQSTIAITCAPTGGAVCPTAFGATMTVPSLPSGGTMVFHISATTNLGASGTFSDTMNVASDTTDDNANNNTATVTDTVVSNDVSVVATAPAAPLTVGPATFTMVIANAGPDDALNVVLATTVSANLMPFSSSAITCVANANTGTTASPVAALPTLQTNGTLISTLIPATGSLTCQVPVTVVSATNGTATVSMSSTTVGDSHSSNNVGTASVSANLTSDLNITAGAGPATLAGGSSATLTYAIGNAGPATANDVTITNTLTAGLKLGGAISCTAAGGAVAPTLQPGGESLVSPSIPINGTLSCSVPVTVVAGTNATVSSTLVVSAASDTHTGDNTAKVSIAAVSSDLGVTESGPTQIGAGNPVQFVATVASGQGAANNVSIQWTHSVPPTGAAGVTFAVPTCVPTGAVTCPTPLGPTMTLPSMPPGTKLTFTFVANTTTADRGAIVNTVKVASDGDPNTNNNSASSTTTLVNANSGTYQTFGADGFGYLLAIDFDKSTYTMSGSHGPTVTHSFTLNATSGDYVVSGAASGVQFRVAQDLIVGGHDFASGVLPYVAARNFVTTLAGAAQGQYDLATRNVPSAGAASTHAGTALISSSILSVCQSDTAVTTVGQCAPASNTSYTVTGPTQNFFTATDTTTSAVYTFYIVNSGATQFLLSAGLATDGSGSQQFRIGLPDSQTGLIGGTLFGPSTTSDWVKVTLTNSTYAFTGTLGSDSANLARINGSSVGPFSMLDGQRASDNALIDVLQAYPLAVVVGGFGQPSSGLLQVVLP